ncbi:sensor histidine kinase [Pedobacter flavus]|uniref:Histidine kinase n=1 Tax=Pedobacter flavus TaxID=3113906 RepID=A0ABU7GZB4_9SPHI|nr:histidine kinase [Pedobacter sp. VNH31]MEE1884290.1 histidine kinase [Pedobacter sp. VNH31]
MKHLLFLFLILSTLTATARQTETDTQKKVVGTDSTSTKDMVFIGSTWMERRNATPEQLRILRVSEKMESMKKDHFSTYLQILSSSQRKSLLLRFKKDTAPTLFKSHKFQTIIVNGKTELEIADAYITPDNAENYLYRIVKNESETLIPWKKATEFRKTRDGKFTYAYLGKISSQEAGNTRIEVQHLSNYNDKDLTIIDWNQPKKPNLVTYLGYYPKNETNLISYPLQEELENPAQKLNFIESEGLNNIKIRMGDSLSTIQFLRLSSAYNFSVTLKSTINKNETIQLGTTNGNFSLHKAIWEKAGEYAITFTPEMNKYDGTRHLLNDKAYTFKFTVLPPLDGVEKFTSKELLLLFTSVLLLSGLIIYIVLKKTRLQNDKKLRQEQQKKEWIKTQLSTVRLQLNPHFIFNALSSIQNLMNKNAIEESNSYLAKFARITRQALNENELITIAEESKFLDDYLQMEQLRNPFLYEINVNQALNKQNIEIPSMLLQPIVENAVRHGVNGKEKGKISIQFYAEKEALVISIEDNGKGFDMKQKSTGLGLSLSKKRIELLNALYPENTFSLKIKASDAGTLVKIYLEDWL